MNRWRVALVMPMDLRWCIRTGELTEIVPSMLEVTFFDAEDDALEMVRVLRLLARTATDPHMFEVECMREEDYETMRRNVGEAILMVQRERGGGCVCGNCRPGMPFRSLAKR